MSNYEVVKYAHALIGTVALITFWTSAITRKGSPIHKGSGKIYLLAMTGIVLSGFYLALQAFTHGHPITAVFLCYLLIITANAMWSSWRAIKDKRNPNAYFGRGFALRAGLMALSGVGILIFGALKQQPIFMAFSLIGLVGGFRMWRKHRQPPTESKWWLREHLGAMGGNGIATHIAFINIGLPKLLPFLSAETLQNFGWIGTLVVGTVLITLATRKYLGTSTDKAVVRN